MTLQENLTQPKKNIIVRAWKELSIIMLLIGCFVGFMLFAFINSFTGGYGHTEDKSEPDKVEKKYFGSDILGVQISSGAFSILGIIITALGYSATKSIDKSYAFGLIGTFMGFATTWLPFI